MSEINKAGYYRRTIQNLSFYDQYIYFLGVKGPMFL